MCQPKAAHHIASVAELLEHIIEFCDFRSMLALKSTTRFFRKSVLANLRDRVSDALSLYIPRSGVENFLRLLDNSNSIVVGRLVMAVLHWNQNWILPARLCVSAPNWAK